MLSVVLLIITFFMGHSHDNMEIIEFSDVSLEGCLGLLVVFGNLEKECGKEK